MISAGCIDEVIGGIFGGLGGDDEPQPVGTMLDKNKQLAMALMKAQLGRKSSMPMRPNLPKFNVNPQIGTGSSAMGNALAHTKYSGGM